MTLSFPPAAAAAAILYAGAAAGDTSSTMHAPTAHTLTAPHVARNALSLTGEWSMLIEHGDLAGWDEQKADAVAGWTTVNIPGQLFPVKDREYFMGITCVWLRTTFTLTPAQAAAGQVLSWGGVRFGAQVWLNGTLIAECVHAGPFTARIPPGIARAGRNTLVLKINGFADMLKAASGFPLFANSAFMQGWGAKNPCVIEDIRIEFYNGVYIKHALAMPDVTAGTATMRVSLEWGREAAGPVTLDAVVREQDTGAEAGRARCTVAAGASTTDLVVRIASPHLWSPGSPYLYSAELIAEGPKGSGDRIRFTFGMREITIVNGHYHLNGKPLWLRGSNLVTDWNWAVLNNIDAREYIVKEARDMNINCFRTHTLPPPASWLNIADAYGMMILAEMPVLFNYADPKYTPDELAVYHSNCIAEVSEWITRLWNHPSVVIWVISNESHDKEWEMGPYHDHVRQLDPTRTTIRAGEETAECIDRHWCSNITRDHVQDDIETLLRDRMASGGNRTIGCTEYMNVFNERDGLVNQWCGTPDISLFPFLFAEICMEHTEAMRRAGLDCILPYMYAGWTRMRTRELWRDDYPTPMAAALHSSFAPVLASFDLSDRNFAAGARAATPVVLINELDTSVHAAVDICLTPANPLSIPEETALRAAIMTQRFDRTLAPQAREVINVQWNVPAATGVYYLAAVTRREGDTPAVSQRTVRSVQPPAAAALAGRTIAVLGADEAVTAWCAARGARLCGVASNDLAQADAVLIWSPTRLSPAESNALATVRRYAQSGGRVVAFLDSDWDAAPVTGCTVTNMDSKADWGRRRAFPYRDATHALTKRIASEGLVRWNGLEGIVATAPLCVDAAPGAHTLYWSGNPDRPCMAAIPAGEGEVIVTSLLVRGRITRGTDAYDPSAEQVLAALLSP